MNKNSIIPSIVLVFYLSACGTAATQLPASTNTLALPPTSTLPPTETPIPPTPTPEFLRYYTESFENDLKYWPSFIVDGNNSVIAKEGIASAVLKAEDGWFKFDLQRSWLWAYSMYDPFEYKDVRLDASVDNLGNNNNNISLICRYSAEDGWYEFNVANSGLWWIYHALPRPDGYVGYKELGTGGSNSIVQGHGTNEYGALCKGDTLTLLINGDAMKEVKGDGLTSGKVGVSVSSFGALPVEVNYDWVKISEP